jgi:hypothetical protein
MDLIVENFPTFWHIWLAGTLLVIIAIFFVKNFVFPA